MNVQDDCLTSTIKDLVELTKINEDLSFTESQKTRDFRDHRPEAQLFCLFFQNHYLTSFAYGRGSDADNFVAAVLHDQLFVGKILFFAEIHPLDVFYEKSRY